ncbi:MAG TPA: GNAT family N-acetyltransferase [Anaerolineales bacterium]|nr:GNAT family N-acetyltransferase [Anaerolineales bacterium]HNO31773.1 GNAT family N-acetyltransferase [Anaerolineales bacterium]
MSIDLEKLEIIHNPDKNRFELWIDGLLSELNYRENHGTIVMTHVGVHPAHRGQGVAGKITRTALEYAKEKNLRVVPLCPYVADYLLRNPQYEDLTRLKTDS